MKARYKPRSGFSDYDRPSDEVDILGFVYGAYEPGYQRSGTKTCTLAVIALPSGRITTAELSDLTYIRQDRGVEE